MNRIISEELYNNVMDILQAHATANPKWVYQGKEQDPSGVHTTLNNLRNTPAALDVSGDHRKDLGAIKDYLIRNCYSLFSSDTLHDIACTVQNMLDSLRTQPQAPVVEVPSVEELEDVCRTELRKIVMEDGRTVWDELLDHEVPLSVPRAIHALLQSRKETVVEVPNISEAVEEINEARMTVLDSMEKQSTVKVIVQYLDNAVALLQSKGG